MREDDGADRLGRDLLDTAHQLFRQRGRSQRIDHHHTGRRHHKARVRDEVAVRGRAQRRQALHVVHIGRDLLGFHLRRRSATHWWRACGLGQHRLITMITVRKRRRCPAQPQPRRNGNPTQNTTRLGHE
ncbi:hypothetical protein SDC9_147381 [bioreactor metagenome]|uniref:Uncharacterized protein n=1 Tax=bioreactor metagenome TaxID=1076179 RepID=A0A645EEI9_9ZZZZ